MKNVKLNPSDFANSQTANPNKEYGVQVHKPTVYK